MQRSMSYRKPVPTYVPSPPCTLDLQVPPLPPNWREVLVQAGKLPPRLHAKSRQLLPTDTGGRIEMDMTELASSVTSEVPKGSNSTAHGDGVVFPSTLNAPCSQKHPLHHQYRPPTPPIPSQHKHRSRQSLLNPDNLILDDANSEATLAHDVHRIDHFGLYHDYTRGPDASSLKISSSFRTDKTMGSFNTLNLWPQGATVRGLSNSSLLDHRHDRDPHKIAGDMSESVDPACWKGLGSWAKKLWDFVIICK